MVSRVCTSNELGNKRLDFLNVYMYEQFVDPVVSVIGPRQDHCTVFLALCFSGAAFHLEIKGRVVKKYS